MKKMKKILSDVFYYIQGNIRYSLYYSEYKYLIPEHIKGTDRFKDKDNG